MTGFEPRTSDIGSDHSTNCATTVANMFECMVIYRVPPVQTSPMGETQMVKKIVQEVQIISFSASKFCRKF